MAATITDITTRTSELGRVVAAMRTHQADAVVEFDALGAHFRTQRTLGGWDIARVDEAGTVQARVTIRSNILDLYPQCRRFVLTEDSTVAECGCVVISSSDTIVVLLADALVHVRHA